ncbi:alcohol dehydrogenase catalytic domain-containing protein [Streptomyces acidiscabies]|uniref:alcohol dehydrogenase catalytic domain-containing protein n=1 Tax=Streptomyces acidiscabies TaxID=42234 RepID=UPI0038F5EB4A
MLAVPRPCALLQRLTEVPDPAPGPREVVVEVAACGLCGTDPHILQGEIVGLGSEVSEPAIGDRVAVDPSLYCHECAYCRTGHNNLCERWAAIGVAKAAENADELERPQGWDIVADATGAGTFLQFGVADYATRVAIDPYRIYNQEITITSDRVKGVGRKVVVVPR